MRVNDKPIKGLKYIRGSLIKESVLVCKEVPVKRYKKPVYNETILRGQEHKKIRKIMIILVIRLQERKIQLLQNYIR